MFRALVFSTTLCLSAGADDGPPSKPNILFIAVDDLNDWIGCMGGHPQSITPNFDRLAASGLLFTNAHCPAPSCNPSRSAVMTGVSPERSGIYSNNQPMREFLPEAVLMPRYFANHGYRALGSGKMLHYFTDAHSWDDYFPPANSESPIPETYYPETRPVSLPVGGPWQYVETDWGPMPVDDKTFGGDWLVSKWVGEQLTRSHDKPFFLACGIYRPHEPWFVPEAYFKPFPLESVELPPGYLEDDLSDTPAAAQKLGPNRYFEHIQKHDEWQKGVQGYLASIHFADAMLGRVLDALENGPNKDNTIVALWSDHGWHLGEKQHWQKYTGWRASTRVPLILKVPDSAAPTATRAGGRCSRPVNILSLFPTLLELAGLPPNPDNDAPSLAPLLKDPTAAWPHRAVTIVNRPHSYAISGDEWRYIHHADGGEELYHIAEDPYEWVNLAGKPAHSGKLADLRAHAPPTFAPYVAPSTQSLPKLKWVALGNNAKDRKPPASKPDGGTFAVFFRNEGPEEVKLWWVDQKGNLKSYGTITPGKTLKQTTRPGAVWCAGEDQPRGWFRVGDRSARAVIR